MDELTRGFFDGTVFTLTVLWWVLAAVAVVATNAVSYWFWSRWCRSSVTGGTIRLPSVRP